MADYAYLGLTLRLLRQQRHVSGSHVVAWLSAHQYPMALTIYNAIEYGIRLPHDVEGFLVAIRDCLSLTRGELVVLVGLCSLAVLTQELGEELALASLFGAVPSSSEED